MIACLLWLALATSAPTGTAFHYERSGALAHVAALRHEPIAWERISGLASLPDCRYVAPRQPYFVRARFWERGGWGPWYTLQVVDCSQRRDLTMQRRRGLVLEVDRGTADRGGWAWNGQTGAGRTRVQVGRIWQEGTK